MYTLDAEEIPTIEGGPFNGSYEFAQLHFHWVRKSILINSVINLNTISTGW